jgi:dTDP-4-dehydrorhamnose 3,5-epimerase
LKIRQLSVPGAWEVTPVLHGDHRGLFSEWYRFDQLSAEVGHPLRLAQGNLSVSAKGAVRGVHYADVPPGQAKYIMCTKGAVLDVVVDIRVGSPAFGRWDTVRLDDVDRRAVYLSEGLGHGFCALTDDATVIYLVSETFNPAREHAINPLDPDLAIEWPAPSPILSAKDLAAPSLTEAQAAGRLPRYADCEEYTQSLRLQ